MPLISSKRIQYDVTQEFSRDGRYVTSEIWEIDGKRTRYDGPAYIERCELTGETLVEIWCIDDVEHRQDGPSHIQYHNGVKIAEEWRLGGMLHRVDGPAWIAYDLDSGKPTRMEWWQRNTRQLDPKIEPETPNFS